MKGSHEGKKRNKISKQTDGQAQLINASGSAPGHKNKGFIWVSKQQFSGQSPNQPPVVPPKPYLWKRFKSVKKGSISL